MKALDFILRGFLLLVFCSQGLAHFLDTEFFVKMIPPYIPYPTQVVLITGFFVLLMAVAMMIPELKSIASKVAVVFLIGYLPAVFHMLGNRGLFPEIAPQLLLLRLPAHMLMIVIAWYLSGWHSPMYFFLKTVDPEELEPENQPPPDEEDEDDQGKVA